MANELQFYYSNDNLPDVKDGNIYFILNDANRVAQIKVDLKGNRYDIKPEYSEATASESGLMSAEDKRKLIPFSITQESNDKIQIDGSADFNFLKELFINDSQVLTQDSFAQVEVIADDSITFNTIEIVPYEDIDTGKTKYKLKLQLNLPRGPQGEQGPAGKNANIGNITYSTDDNVGIPEVTVTKIGEPRETENSILTDLRFDFKNIKGETGEQGPQGEQGIQGERGPQGQVFPVKFNFISGQSVTTTSEVKENEDGSINRIEYIITIPRGEKGDPGKPFRISRTYSSIEEMQAAFEQPAQIDGKENPNGIPLDSFVIIAKNPNFDPQHPDESSTDSIVGELYYRDSKIDSNLIFITDMSPTQPTFTIESVNTLNSNENANVTINNVDVANPKLTFSIPRGKQLTVNEEKFECTIDKNFGTPKVTGRLSESGEIDDKKLNLSLDFSNMGTVTPIRIGNVDISHLNEVSETPTVQVTSTESADGVTQLLNFVFAGLKGVKGDAADSFDTSNTGITAEYHTDNLNPAPRAQVTATTENSRINLKFDFYNLKGDKGELKSVSTLGDGNAITSIETDPELISSLKLHKDITFATENFSKNADNLINGVTKVNVGGTGLNSIPFNSLLAGNGTSELQIVPNASGALFSDGSNKPKFDILPTSLGGTGTNSLTVNSVLVGNGTEAVKNIASMSGALYATASGYTPQFGTLPVPQGGTGQTSFNLNSVLLGNTNSLKTINSRKGAFYSTGENAEPAFGTLPVDSGGTGATTAAQARINIGATHTSLNTSSQDNYATTNNYILSFENVVTPV